MRHLFAGHADNLEAHGGMLSRETVHRVQIEQMQPCLDNRPATDDVYFCVECGRNAEHIAWTLEHFQYLFPSLGIRAKEIHSPRFEKVEASTRVPLHENHLARWKSFRPAMGGDGPQHHWIEIGKLRGRRQDRKYCVTRIHKRSQVTRQ
jgi:hypothetical protein